MAGSSVLRIWIPPIKRDITKMGMAARPEMGGGRIKERKISKMFGKTETTTIAVEGMTCGHCQKRVADALRAVKGVKSVEVSLEKKSAEVSFAPGKTDREQLVQAVAAAGYTAQ